MEPYPYVCVEPNWTTLSTELEEDRKMIEGQLQPLDVPATFESNG